MNKSLLRKILLVIVSALDWFFSVGYMREMYLTLSKENLIEYADEAIVDGADISPFVNLSVAATNGFVSFIMLIGYVFITTIFIAFFALILRAATIRKKDVVEHSEIKFTKWFIIISSAAAFIVSILVSNVRFIVYAAALCWQQPVFMLMIYYLPLRNRFKNGREEVSPDNSNN
ncbi:MAG: hypothetical protein J6K17_03060 [Oscillospiraceae bacterium]|nr:hypothetical protein [Oscillospiraceae bacterium]